MLLQSQNWVILLVLLCGVLHVGCVNIYGTTDDDHFPCHCADEDDCVQASSDDYNGCISGECDESVDYAAWGGPGCQEGNVALGKGDRAEQTGTSGNTAERAVDGDMDSHASAHPGNNELYWNIDLGEEYYVYRITVYLFQNEGDERDIIIYTRTNNRLSEEESCRVDAGRDANVMRCDVNRIVRHIRVERAVGDETIRITELYADGYLYYRCTDPYDGRYYWGPGCLRDCEDDCDHQCYVLTGKCGNCHCTDECDYNDGSCEGECNDYSVKDRDNVCQPCDDVMWGQDCEYDCHCEVCDDRTGRCEGDCDVEYGHDATGRCIACRDGYWGVNCANDCHCSVTCDKTDGACDGECTDRYAMVDDVCSICHRDHWGDRCQYDCHCRGSCGDEDGDCTDGCVSGYGNSEDRGGRCTECDDGLWDRDCRYTCNCRDNGVCNKTTGVCPNGCPDWVVYEEDIGCHHLLPRMGGQYVAVVPEESNGIHVIIEFLQCDGVQCGSVDTIRYRIEYRTSVDNEWLLAETTSHRSNGRNKTKDFTLPEYRQLYQVRLVPYEDETPHSLSGEPTKTILVRTDCRDGRWGEECERYCRCNADNVICNKTSGVCDRCGDGYIGSRCDIRLPRIEGEATAIISGSNLIVHYDKIPNHEKYTVEYITQVRIAGTLVWRNYTSPARRKRDATLQFEPQMNTEYEVRIVPIVTADGERHEGGYLDAITVASNCTDDLVYSPFPGACSHWCECDRQMCLLTTDYCNTVCTDNNMCDYPLPDNTHVNIQPGVDMVNITVSRAGSVTIYDIIITGDNTYNLTALPGESTVISGLQPASIYDMKVTPLFNMQDKVYYGRIISRSFTTAMAEGNKSSNNVVVIIIPIILILLLVIIIVILVILYRRGKLDCIKDKIQKKSKPVYINQAYNESPNPYKEPPTVVEDDIKMDVAGPSSVAVVDSKPPVSQKPVNPVKPHIKTPPATPMKPKVPSKHYDNIYETVKKPIKVKDLEKYMSTLEKNDGYEKEYKSLSENTAATTEAASRKDNFEKHRFFNILAYDHSRVLLDVINGETHTDYINASYIDGYGGKKREFVASQAPRKCTIDDMWRMIWKLESNIIVMLTNLEEGNRVKCQPYWPVEDAQETFMDITVELIDTSCYGFYIHRHLLVTRGTENRRITHLQFTQWPDHGVPITSELLEFFYNVKAMEGQRVGPLLVHCSAGVGRTGSFIALDYLLKQARKEGQVDVVGCVSAMRKDRTQMIQAHTQYRFVFMALLEALTTGNTSTKTLDITDEMFEDMDSLQKRYDNLEKMRPELADEDAEGFRRENRDKNRDLSCVPLDSCTLYLLTPVEGCNQYINAVMCDTYNRKSMLILTQLPLPHTIPDVWRLAVDHSAAGIVLLEDEVEDVYWPQTIGESCQHGPISVKFASESSTIYEGITSRTFTVKPKANASEVNLKQWHVKISDEELQTTDGMNIWLQVYQIVSRWMHIQEDVDATVILQCRNGARMSGMFAALWSVLEKMTAVGVLDVDFAVKRIRRRRPEAIANLEQYHLLHRMAKVKMEDDTGGYYNTSDIASLENSL